jgi:hypothetical protein
MRAVPAEGNATREGAEHNRRKSFAPPFFWLFRFQVQAASM